MTNDQMHGLIDAIINRVTGTEGNTGCAPVKLTIGYVSDPSNQVKGDGVVILDAPPAILDVINQFVRDERTGGHSVFAQPGHGGVLIF